MTTAWKEIQDDELCPVCGQARRCKQQSEHPGDLILCFRQSAENINGFRRIKTTGECSTYVRVGSAADKGSSPRRRDLDAYAKQCAARITEPQVGDLAHELGVAVESLRVIDVGHTKRFVCFPERRANGCVVGLCRRHPDGTKKVGKGEHRGLYIPEGWSRASGPILIVEGASDTAAVLTMGLPGIGRPNDGGGAAELSKLLAGRDVIVLGEWDEKADGKWPGRDGAVNVARAMASEWNRPVRWALPPQGSKDIRAYLNQHGNGDPADAGGKLLRYLQEHAQEVPPGDTPDTDEDKPKKSQATRIVELACDMEYFCNPDGDAWVTFTKGDHRENHRLRSKAFRRHVVGMFHRATGKAPGAQAVQDAIAALEARAFAEGVEHSTSVRVGGDLRAVYIDLGCPRWRAAEITAAGWRVVGDPPVKFRRAKGMVALPEPEQGGTVDMLRPFVNVGTDDDFRLLVAWLTAALLPMGPYPVLLLVGEAGSTKSTQARIIVAIIDPRTTPLRAEPNEARDLMIAANNGFLIALDNLSYLPPWLSDALCRLSTGGGFATRELYTDGEEALFCATRPVVINGIEDLATRGDLTDRVVSLYLPQLPDRKRQTERKLWAAFNAVEGKIVGALFEAVARGLRELPNVELKAPPRMADFAHWGVAVGRALGWPERAFLNAYRTNRAAVNEIALGGSPVADALRKHITASWSGTLGELLAYLDPLVDRDVRKLKGWPKAPRAMGAAVRRLAPNLRADGWVVDLPENPRQGESRSRTLELVPPGALPGPERRQSAKCKCRRRRTLRRSWRFWRFWRFIPPLFSSDGI